MIFGQPVDGPRIVPFGEQRLPTDVLPNGRPGFRVTQRFDDPDSYHGDGRLHAALDIGNFSCGDRVVTMGPGWAVAGTDNAGGRYVIVDHGNGWVSRYWHLNDWSVTVGARTQVGKGQQLGIVGRTGLGNVCHLHLEVALNGRKRDLWPLLEQNAGLPDTSTEDPMTAWTDIDHVRYIPPTVATVKAGTILFRGPGREYDEQHTLPGDERFICQAQVNLPSGRGLWWLLTRLGQQGAFFAPGSAILGSETIAADCSAEVAAVAEGRDKRIANLKAISATANQKIQNG